MEHGEPCVMISGVQWMQVWPADNWASLETVRVYCCHCCCSIQLSYCLLYSNLEMCHFKSSLFPILQMQLHTHVLSMARELDPFG